MRALAEAERDGEAEKARAQEVKRGALNWNTLCFARILDAQGGSGPGFIDGQADEKVCEELGSDDKDGDRSTSSVGKPSERGHVAVEKGAEVNETDLSGSAAEEDTVKTADLGEANTDGGGRFQPKDVNTQNTLPNTLHDGGWGEG